MIPIDRHAPLDAPTILENVGWIIDHLDEHGLEEMRDLPVLEMAKHIAVMKDGGSGSKR